MSNKKPNTATRLLEGAYALRTANDNIDYYRDFSRVYDEEFAEGMGYVYPATLVSVYREYAKQTDTPVVDIGCGTGLVAQALATQCNLRQEHMDGIDISPEMLLAAEKKALYRSLHQIDLTLGTGDLPGHYGAVLSAGTFTFGHLGPGTLPDLLHIGRTGTLFCIGINSEHFAQQGFNEVLQSMIKNNQITTPEMVQREIYTEAGNDHAGDTATILIYRQT